MCQLVDREHRLNAALLRSGKFKEAIATLMDWMKKMNETLEEQKLTSTDYKFLKAQLQMQQVTTGRQPHQHRHHQLQQPDRLVVL